MELFGFLFAELEEGQAVEVLRVGEFVDRNGREVTITDEDLDEFVANFEAGAAGQEVPVDVNHERGEAAGWIRSLARAGNTLTAVPDWNEVGLRLVSEKIYQYLSATIDVAKKVIKSVSLVNFPAVKGLRPVELAEGIYTLQAQGLFGRIVSAISDVFNTIDLADGIPGTIAIGDFLQSRIHKAFTVLADDMASAGYLSVEERIQLSNAIGEALDAFRQNVGEAGERLIKVDDSAIGIYFQEGDGRGSDMEEVEFVIRKEDNEIVLYSQDGEKVLGRFPFGSSEKYADEDAARAAAAEREKEIERIKHIENEEETMSEEEKAALREEIRAEIEAEMVEKELTRAELREQVQAEVEAELAERYERRQGFVEFAEEICGGEAGLSAKPDDVVAVLEAAPDGQVELIQALLKAKVVDFIEHGSNREGGGDKKKLEGPYAVQLRAWREAGQTVSEFFELNADVLGEADEYDLSEFENTDSQD